MRPQTGHTKELKLEVDGVVVQVMRDLFRVEISPDMQNNHPKLKTGVFVLARISGKLRKHFVRVVLGDRVKVEVSPYDLKRGRIIIRLSDRKPSVMASSHDSSKR